MPVDIINQKFLIQHIKNVYAYSDLHKKINLNKLSQSYIKEIIGKKNKQNIINNLAQQFQQELFNKFKIGNKYNIQNYYSHQLIQNNKKLLTPKDHYNNVKYLKNKSKTNLENYHITKLLTLSNNLNDQSLLKIQKNNLYNTLNPLTYEDLINELEN